MALNVSHPGIFSKIVICFNSYLPVDVWNSCGSPAHIKFLFRLLSWNVRMDTLSTCSQPQHTR